MNSIEQNEKRDNRCNRFLRTQLKTTDVLQQQTSHSTAPDHAAIVAATNELRDLLLRKNANYGGSWKQPDCFGGAPEASLRCRVSDKLARLKNLLTGAPDTVGESVRDTMLDLAGYFLLWSILRKDTTNHDV